MANSDAPPRLLFCSYHYNVDPSSGAALATRDLMELLAAAGWPCGVFSGPQLDYEQGESLAQILADYGHQPDTRHSAAGQGRFTVYHFHQGGVPVSVLDHRDARPYHPPTAAAGRTFLTLLKQVLEKFRPDVVLTYGGYGLAPEVIARAKRRGARVVFVLYNFAYDAAEVFRPVDVVASAGQAAVDCRPAEVEREPGMERCRVLVGFPREERKVR